MPGKHLLFLLAVLTVGAFLLVVGFPDLPEPSKKTAIPPPRIRPDSLLARLQIPRLEAEIRTLQKTLNRHRDGNPYIVIDTVHNRLQVRQDGRMLREATCATGSGKVLIGSKPNDIWAFITPKKVFRIQRKVEDPVWAKPVWAFVETGETAPVLPWAFNRLDQTTLGKYALELGDSYEIHGTLYPNLLGRHITHGCIRLNDEDLASAYALTRVGDRVYIY